METKTIAKVQLLEKEAPRACKAMWDNFKDRLYGTSDTCQMGSKT